MYGFMLIWQGAGLFLVQSEAETSSGVLLLSPLLSWVSVRVLSELPIMRSCWDAVVRLGWRKMFYSPKSRSQSLSQYVPLTRASQHPPPYFKNSGFPSLPEAHGDFSPIFTMRMW